MSQGAWRSAAAIGVSLTAMLAATGDLFFSRRFRSWSLLIAQRGSGVYLRWRPPCGGDFRRQVI